jgi:hypothetical protein
MAPRYPTYILATLLIATPLALHAQAPVGELYSTVAKVRGAVTLASGGTTVISGSSIEAGEQPASLVLNRGGNLAICQGTTVAVSASANGNNLMFSFGSGTIEARYSVSAASDVVITPDLRFDITGPGEFDLDIGITSNGDTCVHSRKASTGGVIVHEQMGDGSYQIKPSDFVVFRKGRVADVEVNPAMNCGCPAVKEPARQTVVAEATPATPPRSVQPTVAIGPNEHLQVDAPFVFNADQPVPVLTGQVMKLRVESNSAFADLRPAVQPPPAKPAKKGFWHRIVAALFE